MNKKTIISAIALTLLCAAVSHAQNYGSYYNSSYTGPNGRTVSYSQSYTQGAGGWMGTGCPQGVGWAIFAVNALGAMRSGAPIPTPNAAPVGGYYGGGCYGGGCYGGGVYGQPYTVPTYRAGWGCVPH